MSQNDDTFVKTFSVVVGGLVLFAMLLVVFASMFHEQLTPEVSEARLEAVDERIKPVGAVYAGESGAQALAAAEEPPEEAESSGDTGPMSGEAVYDEVCAVCHGAGVGGAPKLRGMGRSHGQGRGSPRFQRHRRVSGCGRRHAGQGRSARPE